MGSGTVEAVAVGAEGFGDELASRTYKIMRILSRGPQDERYIISRYYGVGFAEQSAEQIQADMGITAEEFEELRRRGVRRLREAERG